MFERVLLSASIVLFVKVSVDPAKIYDCKSEISASTILIVFEAVLIVLLVNVSVVSFKTIVPEAFGKLIVLSAVGSITPNTVS